MRSLVLDRDPDVPLSVLCVGAHSDDIEIGCGGLLLTLLAARKRVHVHWVVFSATGPRAREARHGARLFLAGATPHVSLKTFRDGFFPYEGAKIKRVFEQLKVTVNPDLVLTHYRHDRHQDHRVVSDLTWNTFRDHLILEYEIPKFDGDLGVPNLFVTVDEHECRRKVEYLTRVFGSQRNKHWFSAPTFMGLMRLRGMECRAPSGYAEAFHVRKTVMEFT